MNISPDLFSSAFIWFANIVVFAALVLSLFFIHWSALRQDTRIQHILGLCTVVLMVIWSIRAGISDGLGIHLFLITALHLLMGWQLAIWVACFAITGTILVGLESAEGFGVNMLVSVLIPLISNYCVWLAHHKSNAMHPFSFVFLVAFLGGALSVFASGIAMTAIVLIEGIYSFEQVVNEFWIFIPLIAFPEAFINGMLISILIFNHPEWVRLFDQQRYFGTRK